MSLSVCHCQTLAPTSNISGYGKDPTTVDPVIIWNSAFLQQPKKLIFHLVYCAITQQHNQVQHNYTLHYDTLQNETEHKDT
jgi:hypothetical protein